MIYKKFGDKLKVSSIVLGSDWYGTEVSGQAVFDIFDKYVSLGGNTIDTARMYTQGMSEQLIGTWMQDRGNRHDICISTKCAHPPVGNMQQSRLSREEIFSDAEESLKTLKTDYIDMLWLHRDDSSLDVAPIIDTLNELIKQGKILSFGASNWSGKRIKEANEYAKKSGQEGFCGSQIKWSIAKSAPDYQDDPTLIEMDKAEYGFYKESKVGVFAYASQAKGFFYKYDNGGEAALSQKSKERYYCKENIEIYHTLKNMCREMNISLTTAVLAALTSNTDFNTVALAGCKSIEQLTTSMEAADAVLPYDEILKILEY